MRVKSERASEVPLVIKEMPMSLTTWLERAVFELLKIIAPLKLKVPMSLMKVLMKNLPIPASVQPDPTIKVSTSEIARAPSMQLYCSSVPEKASK